MWTYSQATGEIRSPEMPEGSGYSGFGEGLNNGALEAEADTGPIPKGRWEIVAWHDTYEDKGPVVAQLEPIGHDAYGRSGFLIHGDNSEVNHTASHGCIIAIRAIRQAWRASQDHDLMVIS